MPSDCVWKSRHLSVFFKIWTSLHGVQEQLDFRRQRSLNENIQQCSIHLEHLQKKLEPGKRRKAMSRCGIRALKWPFERKELEKDLGVLERYKSTFTAALNTDQT